MPVPLQDQLVRQLGRFLGPHTAKNALKVFAQKAVNKAPADLTPADLDPLLAALRPMLRTLVGARETEQLLAEIRQEAGR